MNSRQATGNPDDIFEDHIHDYYIQFNFKNKKVNFHQNISVNKIINFKYYLL